MKLLAPPLYVLTTQTLEKVKGIEALTDACDICRQVIESHKGRLVIKEAARAVSERDDRLLNDQASCCHDFPVQPMFAATLAACLVVLLD